MSDVVHAQSPLDTAVPDTAVGIAPASASADEIDAALRRSHAHEQQPISRAQSKGADDFLASIKAFEADSVALAKRNATRAWQVAIGAGVVAALSLVAVVVMLPLKETEPFMVRVDNTTGDTQLLRPLSEARSITYGEVLDKYFISAFITARNSYEWESVQHNYDVVQMMGSDKVFSAYYHSITAKDSPVNTLGENKKIMVAVQNVTFLPTQNDAVLAQVTFTRHMAQPDGSPSQGFAATTWRATLTVDYLQPISSEAERLINPLGFRVTSYREDRSMTQGVAQ